MARTTFTGPVKSLNGFEGGSGTTTLDVLSVGGSATFDADVTIVGAADVGTTLSLGSYGFSALPVASATTGAIVYCSNCASGAPCVVFSDGADWLRVDTLGTATPTNT